MKNVGTGDRRDDWRSRVERGVALLQRGQPQQAIKQLKQAQRAAPGDRDVRYWLANACRMTGETERAEQLLTELLSERPGDYEASFALAFLQREAGKPTDAAEALLQAARQPGLVLRQLLQVAGFLRDSNQYEAAIEICEKAVAMKPEQADLHFKLGRLYQAVGAFDQSLEAFRETLKLQPATGAAWTMLAQQKRFESVDDADYVRIDAAAAQSFGDEADMCVAFAYGKALDDLSRFPEAWQQYRKGNQIASKMRPWNENGWRRFVQRRIEGAAALPAGAKDGRNAVFVVGMLRSGTTLLEQLLNRHPDITGRGELNFLAQVAGQFGPTITRSRPREMADYLWTQLRVDGPEHARYVDKNPLNFRYVDVLFDLLPDAKVLHVMRDGRDSCLSCFFQLFEHEDTAFSYSLDHLVAYYAGYRRLMAHWEGRFTDRIHRVSYEQLVNDVPGALANILAFLGADWDDAVMRDADNPGVVRTASVWQARQPVHSRSVARWQHYDEIAPDFFTRLSAIDGEYG
jgi:tetratricopeptide (TPR) repeat protein